MNNFEDLGRPLGNERLLSISDVSTMLGISPVTASRFMKETGLAINIGRRLFILDSNLLSYLHSRGVA